MPGHTFCYSPSVNKVRDLIREDVLGEVYFVTSSRMNLGKYQPDGVIMDLAPHDLSILLYWLEQPIVEVGGDGAQHLPGRDPGDRVHHPDVRGRRAGQRPDLVAGPAQGARDDHRRQPADGPVRRHAHRRAGPRLRPRHGVQHAGELRRVPADLPDGRHGRPAGRRRRAPQPRAAGLRQRDPHRKRAPLQRAAGPADRGRRWKRPRSPCAAAASRSRSASARARLPSSAKERQGGPVAKPSASPRGRLMRCRSRFAERLDAQHAEPVGGLDARRACRRRRRSAA